MKVRIYKTQEGKVIVDTPSMKYQELGIDKCPHPGRFRNGEPFDIEVMEYDDLVAIATNNEAGSAQFYYDGDTLKHDDDRSELLMYVDEIKTKHYKRLEKKIDEELNKATPDPVELIRLRRGQEKAKNMTDVQAYQQALANLIEDGHKKPKIKAKLEAKINEITG